jgi:small subunit ribosomal protein S21
MPKVILQQGESQEQLLRRFRKEIVKSRVLTDARRKRWFIPNSELKRIKEKKASRRSRRQF